MYKTAWFHRFRAELDEGAADERWRETDSLVRSVPGIEGFAANRATGPHPSLSGASEERVFFDGYTCAWFADRDTYLAATGTTEWKALSTATDDLFEGTFQEGMSATVEERILKEGALSPFKAVWVLRFREGIDRAWARDFWTNEHARFVIAAPGVDRYLQNHVVATLGETQSDDDALAALGFDGFAECWFEDRDAFLRAVSSEQWAGLVEDGIHLFDMTALWGAVVEERRVGL